MKNFIKILAIISILFCGLVACDTKEKESGTEYVSKSEEGNKSNRSGENIYKEYKTSFDLQHSIDEVANELNLIFDSTKLKEIKNASSLYEADEHDVKAFSYSNSGDYIEIGSIKLKDTDELMWALKIASKRVDTLKLEGKVLDDENGVCIEVNNGVLTLVASPKDALSISDSITKILK